MDHRTSRTIHGTTTPETGRFVISTEAYQLVTDGTTQTGGPGIGVDARELLVVSLLTCALNAIRGGGYSDPSTHQCRQVSIDATVSDPADSTLFADVELAIDVADHSVEETEVLTRDWLQQCRIFTIVRPHFSIHITSNGRRRTADALAQEAAA